MKGTTMELYSKRSYIQISILTIYNNENLPNIIKKWPK